MYFDLEIDWLEELSLSFDKFGITRHETRSLVSQFKENLSTVPSRIKKKLLF